MSSAHITSHTYVLGNTVTVSPTIHHPPTSRILWSVNGPRIELSTTYSPGQLLHYAADSGSDVCCFAMVHDGRYIQIAIVTRVRK